jgi:hypothetical protein
MESERIRATSMGKMTSALKFEAGGNAVAVGGDIAAEPEGCRHFSARESKTTSGTYVRPPTDTRSAARGISI